MELNFVYCFDDNFNLQALTSIKSLLDKITKKDMLQENENYEQFVRIRGYLARAAKARLQGATTPIAYKWF